MASKKNNLPSILFKISLTESIKNSIDKGKFGCGIFLDLQKAFDTVNHKILLDKLEYYGIRGNVFNWFKSHLTECQQYVVVNGHMSDPYQLLVVSHKDQV